MFFSIFKAFGVYSLPQNVTIQFILYMLWDATYSACWDTTLANIPHDGIQNWQIFRMLEYKAGKYSASWDIMMANILHAGIQNWQIFRMLGSMLENIFHMLRYNTGKYSACWDTKLADIPHARKQC